MPRVFVSVVDQIQTLRLAWRGYSPDAVISGMTLAEFEAATAEPPKYEVLDRPEVGVSPTHSHILLPAV